MRCLVFFFTLCLLFTLVFGCDHQDGGSADDDVVSDDDDDNLPDDDSAPDDDDDTTDDDSVPDDDDTADDDDTPFPPCGPVSLCERAVQDCGVDTSVDDCVEQLTDADVCYDPTALLSCSCACYPGADCGSFVACIEQCEQAHCPYPAAVPPEQPEPAIPGQKEQLPGKVDYTMDEEENNFILVGGGLRVTLRRDPFALQIVRIADEETLLATVDDPRDEGFAPLAVSADKGFYWNQFYWGYRGYYHHEGPWTNMARVVRFWQKADRIVFDVRDQSDRARTIIAIGPFYDGAVRIAAATQPGNEADDIDRMAFTFQSPSDEAYLGFGERFNRLDQRGKKIESWLEEGGIEPGSLRPLIEALFPEATPEWVLPSGEDGSYAPIPFFLSNHGYGFLADVPEPTHFDLAATHEDLWQIKAESNELAFVVFAGPTPAEALGQYTARTGRSQVPRPWMLAPWNFFAGYGGEDFRLADIPTSVNHEWTNITPTGSFRGHEAEIVARNEAKHDLGFKVLCYLQPRIDADDYPELWQEAADLDLLTRDENGDAYIQTVYLNIISFAEFHVSHIDFTAPDVDQWWHSVLQNIVDLSYDGTMYDFGEYTPPMVQFADGRDGHYWHNPYPLIYQRSGYNFFRELDDDPYDGLAPDYLYFNRSGYAGSQNWTYAMWSGDPSADWNVSDGLPAQVKAGLNVGLTGFAFWGHDIGGYHAYLVPAPTPELLKRWMQFGAFSGLMRDMVNSEVVNGERPLIFDSPDITYVVRKFQKLRTQLVPYIYNTAWQYRESGLPLMRHPVLVTPEDPAVWDVEYQYYFGDDFYVAPVIEAGATTWTFYLPEGEWINFWAQTEYDAGETGGGTGGFRIGGDQIIGGGQEITVAAPVETIPLFVRLGAAIPVVDPSVDTWADAAPESGVVTATDVAHLLHVWVWPDETTTTTLSDGSELTVKVKNGSIDVERDAVDEEGELWAQIAWTVDADAPEAVGDLLFVEGGDPLALAAGEWTWSETRRAVAFHGKAGRKKFVITWD